MPVTPSVDVATVIWSGSPATAGAVVSASCTFPSALGNVIVNGVPPLRGPPVTLTPSRFVRLLRAVSTSVADAVLARLAVVSAPKEIV